MSNSSNKDEINQVSSAIAKQTIIGGFFYCARG